MRHDAATDMPLRPLRRRCLFFALLPFMLLDAAMPLMAADERDAAFTLSILMPPLRYFAYFTFRRTPCRRFFH